MCCGPPTLIFVRSQCEAGAVQRYDVSQVNVLQFDECVFWGAIVGAVCSTHGNWVAYQVSCITGCPKQQSGHRRNVVATLIAEKLACDQVRALCPSDQINLGTIMPVALSAQ